MDGLEELGLMKENQIVLNVQKENNRRKKQYGFGAKAAANVFSECTPESYMYEQCLKLYTTHEKFIKKDTGEQCTEEDLLMNMNMLYLLRTENDIYGRPE